jgi:hypothetical protein
MTSHLHFKSFGHAALLFAVKIMTPQTIGKPTKRKQKAIMA